MVRRRAQAEIARRYGVTPQAVYKWHQRWLAEGTAGLRSSGSAGFQPFLNNEQLVAAITAEPVAWWSVAASGDRAAGARLASEAADCADAQGLAADALAAWYDAALLGAAERTLERPADLADRVEGPLPPLWVSHTRAAIAGDRAGAAWAVAAIRATGAVHPAPLSIQDLRPT